MNEEWRPIPGYEGRYEVSNLGRVRSFLKGKNGALLKPWLRNGYPAVNLFAPSGDRKFMVHRLVLEAFVGPPRGGHECRHLNGNPLDARLANLKWGTHAENMRDQVAHGTHHEARKTECPKGHPYDEENVLLTAQSRRECLECRRLRNVARGYGNPGRSSKPATHCRRGHPFDEANTLRNSGKRLCRTCRLVRLKAQRVARREQAANS